jgi:hypothetical protein
MRVVLVVVLLAAGGLAYALLRERHQQDVVSAIGLAYARAMANGDAAAACGHARGEVARQMRCGSGAPHVTTVAWRTPLKVTHAWVDHAQAQVRVGGRILELRRAGETWRIVRDYVIGLA